MSTANYVEAGAVMARRQQLEPSRAILELENILSDTAITLIPVDERQARLALDARIHFGHGFGARAGLNFGDSFAYALAKALDAPLLFVGDDFRETDITPAV
jgi:ribonuclease VapC